MAEAGTYYVSVVPDMSKFNSALDKGAKRSQSVFGRIASIGIGTAFGNAMSKGVSAFVGTLDKGISRLDTLNNFPKIMANMGIGADESKKAINQLSEAIDGLPTSLDMAALGTQRLVAKNGDLAKSTQYFTALNNAILSGGASAEIQSSAIEQLTQSYSKGQMDMMEWRTLQMAMPAQLNQVAKAMGLTTEQLGAGLRKAAKDASYLRDVDMDEFMDTLVRLNEEGGEGFASLSEQASVSTQTIGTALANVQNRMSKAWTTILDSVGQERIAGAINKVSESFGVLAEAVAPIAGDVADKLADVFQRISDYASTIDFSFVSQAFADVATAAQPLTDALNQFISGEGPAFEGMMQRIGDHLAAVKPTWDMLVQAFSNFATVAAPIVVELLGYIGSAMAAVVPIALWLASGVVQLAADILSFVTAVATNIPKIPSYFSSMVASVKTYFSNLLSTVQGIPGRIVGYFSGIGSRISAAIGSIHFPKPHVTWEKLSVAGMKTPISLPHVNWYAQGGLVNGAQLIGAGEKGAELMWPSYEPYMGKYAQAIAEHMPAAAGADVTNIYIDGLRVNDDEAIRADVLNLVSDMRRLGAMNRG